MMLMAQFSVTTDVSGDGTDTIDLLDTFGDNGPYKLHAVEWIDGTFDNGVDAVLTMESTLSGVDTTLLTLTDADNDAWYYVRVLEQDNTGSNLATYTTQVVQGDLVLTVSSGGNAKTGGAVVYLER